MSYGTVSIDNVTINTEISIELTKDQVLEAFADLDLDREDIKSIVDDLGTDTILEACGYDAEAVIDEMKNNLTTNEILERVGLDFRMVSVLEDALMFTPMEDILEAAGENCNLWNEVGGVISRSADLVGDLSSVLMCIDKDDLVKALDERNAQFRSAGLNDKATESLFHKADHVKYLQCTSDADFFQAMLDNSEFKKFLAERMFK